MFTARSSTGSFLPPSSSVRIEAWKRSLRRLKYRSLWSSSMLTGPCSPPYRMPGTRPLRRSRRLAPVPWLSRLRAEISIAMGLLLKSLFDEKRAHRFLGVDAQDRLGDEAGDRQRADLLAGARVLAERNGVGHHQLVEVGALDLVDGAAGEHRVRAVGDDFLRAFLLQHLGRLHQRAGGVDHVVHDHAG